jgi:hypothetical protein
LDREWHIFDNAVDSKTGKSISEGVRKLRQEPRLKLKSAYDFVRKRSGTEELLVWRHSKSKAGGHMENGLGSWGQVLEA